MPDLLAADLSTFWPTHSAFAPTGKAHTHTQTRTHARTHAHTHTCTHAHTHTHTPQTDSTQEENTNNSVWDTAEYYTVYL